MNLDKRLLRLARIGRAGLLFAIVCGLVGGLLMIAQAQLLTRVIQAIFLDRLILTDVRGFLFVLLVIIGLRSGFTWLGEVAANRGTERIKGTLRERLLAQIFDLGPLSLTPSGREVKGEGSGEYLNILTEGIEALDAYFSKFLPQIALAVLIPASIVIVVFTIDPLSGFVLLVTGPLIPFFMYLIGSQADVQTKKQWQALSRLSARFLDAIQGLPTLKIFGRSKEFGAQLSQASEQYRQKTMAVLRITFLSALTLELLATLSTAIVAVQIGLRLLYGYVTFEQAFFVLLLTPEFYLPLRQLGLHFHAAMMGSAAGERILSLLAQDPPEKSQQQRLSGYSTGISIEHVSYTYPDGTGAINNVSFRLEPSTITALAGPSGSGKSTIVNLLLGFISPTSGKITFGGDGSKPLTAWVPQSPYLFNDTVAANLRLAKQNATKDELIAAARLAHADDFIRELPEGFETVIGERGARLSGGQAQRLALARAFLIDAPLLILDEPTAQLDSVTEMALLESARRLAQERIVLIVAHRPATIAAADQVMRLKGGHMRKGIFQPAPQVSENQPVNFFNELSVSNISPGSTRNATNPIPISWLLSFLTPLAPRVLISVLLGFATIIAGIGLMSTSAYIIAMAALHPSIAALQVAIVGVRFFGLSRGIFRYLERLVSHDTTLRVLAHLRDWYYWTLDPLAPGGFDQDNRHSGDLLGRAVSDINTLEAFYVRSAAPPMVAVLVSAVLGLVLATFDIRLGAALLFFLALQGIGMPVVLQKLGQAPGRALVQQRARLNVLLLDALQGMADLLACQAEQYWQELISTASDGVLKAQRKMAQLSSLQNASGVLLANIGMLIVVALAIPLVSAGQLNGVWLAVLALLAQTSFEAVQPLPIAAAHWASHRRAAERLLEIASRPIPVTEPVNPQPIPISISISVDKLSYAFPHSRPHSPTLTDISLSLTPGKKLALIGSSGSGKSTLLKLIARFYDGEYDLRIDGVDIRRYSPSALRAHMAIVPQETYLFSASIRENLLIACPDAAPEAIERAVRAAQLHEWIDSLPQGYETWVGEHGLRIAGGERQRIAMARAFLSDAALLLLDEPTAHLDSATEMAVLEALKEITKGRSVVWATHHLVGMDWMDEIIVLEAGQVVARGTHDNLLAEGGLYRTMWEIQNNAIQQFR